MYKIMITKQAVKDTQMLEQAGLKTKAITLLKVIQQNPYQNPPPFEKLKGCADTYSRRLNIHHRLVYQVLPNEDGKMDENGVLFKGVVKLIRMWTHYE